MIYFNKSNDAMKPFCVYDSSFILYCIDKQNKTAGVEFLFNFNEDGIPYYKKVIDRALEVAFCEYRLNKVYVNVIRDNLLLFQILKAFNFIFESIHREQHFDIKPHDVIYMTVLKGEWEKGGIRYNYNYEEYCIKIDDNDR